MEEVGMNRVVANKGNWSAGLSKLGMIVVLVLGIADFAAGSGEQDKKPNSGGAALSDINISFKVDPRLTRGLYLGDRWVSTPQYTGAGSQEVVEARVEGVDNQGRSRPVDAEWLSADPEMVTVSPSQGMEVKITVKRAGEGRLRVTSRGISKELAIKMVDKANTKQIEVAVLPTEGLSGAAVGQDISTPKDEKEKLSYALGMIQANQLRSQSVEIDPDVYMQGLKTALDGNTTLLTQAEAQLAVNEMQTARIAYQSAQQKEKLTKEKQRGEAFLRENENKEGVVTLPSGLQYKVLKAGDGRKPSFSDEVVCHYRGTLLDGTEFDSSYKRNAPTNFALNKVIKGWSEALQLMSVGSKWQLFVPSKLAYGERGVSARSMPNMRIEPNATLIFEVELLAIKDKSPQVAQSAHGGSQHSTAESQ
jgi:FKBP-type peptidyl-prolyl cis-trans isomerase FklB